MTKPNSMRKFDLFFWGWTLLSLLGVLLNWDEMVRTAAASQQTGEGQMLLEESVMQTIMAVVLVVITALIGLLWYLLSVKRLEFLKWLLTGIVVLQTLVLVSALVRGETAGVALALDILATAASIAAIWMVFRPDSKEWFASRRGTTGGMETGADLQ